VLPINSRVKRWAARRSKREVKIKSGPDVTKSEPFLLVVFGIETAFQTHA
jgi:hypothetical protein